MKKGTPRKRTTKVLPKTPPKNLEDKNISINENLLVACDILSNERYQAFVDNITEGIYEVDVNGNFLYFNDPLCKIFGRTRKGLQFQNFSKFMDEENANSMFATFNKMYQTGQGISDLIWKIKYKDGTPKIIELSANLIFDNEGKKIGFRGVIRDISDKYMAREALEKSERRYRTLVDFIPYPIVLFSLEGRVSYLNPAFTETFGWSLNELQGKNVPFIPDELKNELANNLKRLFNKKIIQRYETQRLTKDGRLLDVVFRSALYSETGSAPIGGLVILRDITQEKRIARNNEAILRITMALPEHPDLEELLDYISSEIKHLLNVEGALVILLDEEEKELYFKSAAHDDSSMEEKIKEIRFSASEGASGKIIRSRVPIMIEDASKAPDFYSVVDAQTGFKTRNLLNVPLRSKDRIIGVLYVMNKKTEDFDQTDLEFLNTIAGAVALSIENARFSEEIKKAYKEVTSLNRAKDKVINHLSHELKTPASILSSSLNILAKRLRPLPEETWLPTIERAQRSLDRILEMQYQVEDIMRARHYETHDLLLRLLDECADELYSLVTEEVQDESVVERIRMRIDETFGLQESPLQEISLDQFTSKVIKEIQPLFSHRQVDIITDFEITQPIIMPGDALKKVVLGLIKNAVENTPDEGKIEISVLGKGKGGSLLRVKDYGVGIIDDNQRRIFEGFFATQETIDYSSKRPFDFNAGGKGADLFRMKIFSERYNFKIDMTSSRCRYIPLDKDICPGKISRCDFCKKKEDCYHSGGTTFSVFFPSP